MSSSRNYFAGKQKNHKEEYLLNETLLLDEETNPHTETEHNKYFELSDYDMKVTKDFEYIFGDEKDNIHFNKNYDEEGLQGIYTSQSPSDKVKDLIQSNNNLKIPFIIVNFIPLIQIIFSSKIYLIQYLNSMKFLETIQLNTLL